MARSWHAKFVIVPRRCLSGQTLLEVLVAMVVLGVGLVAVLEAFSACSMSVSITKNETLARTWAEKMMADLRSNSSLLTSDETGDLGKEHPGFSWRRQVRETPEHGVVAVRMEVNWTNRGVARQYVLETLVRTPHS